MAVKNLFPLTCENLNKPACSAHLIAINNQSLAAIGAQQDTERFDVDVAQFGYALFSSKLYNFI